MENKEDDRLGPQASLAAWGVPRNARAVTTAKRSSEQLGRPLAQVPDPHPCSRNFHRAANHGRGSSAVTGNDESSTSVPSSFSLQSAVAFLLPILHSVVQSVITSVRLQMHPAFPKVGASLATVH